MAELRTVDPVEPFQIAIFRVDRQITQYLGTGQVGQQLVVAQLTPTEYDEALDALLAGDATHTMSLPQSRVRVAYSPAASRAAVPPPEVPAQ